MELFEKRWSNLLLYLFGFVIGFSISQALSVTTEKTPHCVWYGECARNGNDLKQNCPYDGPPKPLDPEGQEILSKWCPEFVSDMGDGVKTCCDTAQARTFDISIRLINDFIKDTPCMHNFLKQVCALTCSPEQSRFLDVTKVKTDSNGTKYINAIDYYISNSYMTGTFNSCKQVRMPDSIVTDDGAEWVLDILCPEWGAARCTPARWFYVLGDADTNPFVPFQISYINSSVPVNDFVPMNATIEPCNLSV